MAAAQKYNRRTPIDSNDCEEIYIATVGDVDSGKSTLVGCLAAQVTDDGNGSARQLVMQYEHELNTGRTMSCTTASFKKNNRVYTFVDLAGHKSYLRTTITGISCYMPDCAVICVTNAIEQPAKDHLSILRTYEIPIIVCFNKEDLYGQEKDTRRNEVYQQILAYLKTIPGPPAKFYRVKQNTDFDVTQRSGGRLIPYIIMSNKTGEGHTLLSDIMCGIKTRPKQPADVFYVESNFIVTGQGLVLCGNTGFDIEKNDTLYIGPFGTNKIEFEKFRVKSMHNNYRFAVDKIHAGQRGCCATNLDSRLRHQIRRGMVVSRQPVPVCYRFTAKVYVLYHATTISVGYEVLASCGAVSGQVKIVKMRHLTNQVKQDADAEQDADDQKINVIRSGSRALVTFEFKYRPAHLVVGQFMSFLEGNARAVGLLTAVEYINRPTA